MLLAVKGRPRTGLRPLLWPRLTDDVVTDNILLLYHDVIWSSLLSGVTSTFLSVFLLRLGGSALQVSLLVSLPAIGGTFLSLRAARYVHQHRHNLRIVIIPSLLFRLGYPLLAIVPFLYEGLRTWAFVGIIALASLPTIISNIALTSQIGDVLPVDRRADVLSVRNMLSGIGATFAALAGGWALSLLPFPLNYQLVFVVAFLLSLIGLYHRNRLRLPTATLEEESEQTHPHPAVTTVLRRPVFQRFCVGLVAYLAGLYLPSALFSIYLVRTLHASDVWVGIVGTGGSLAATIGYPAWGRLLGRGRLRQMLPIAAVGLGLFPAFISLAPNVVVYGIVSVYGNLFGAGVTTGVTQALIEMGPPNERPTRVALYNTVAGAAAFALPLVGTLLLNYVGIHGAFFLAAALRLAGAAFFATMPRWEPDKG